MTDSELNEILARHSEPVYKAFTEKLTPTGYPILGVRLPFLRKLAATAPPADEIQPDSHEKILLKGFVLARQKKPIGEYLDDVAGFLPLIDNWAVCDCVTASLKPVAKHLTETFERFAPLRTGGAWERRFLAVLLMDYYLTDEYIDRVLDVYRDMAQGEYYVDMAIGWGLSVALVKYWDKTYARLAAGEYSTSVTKKAASKARDSFRIPPDRKEKMKEVISLLLL